MNAVLQPSTFADAEAYLAWEETQTERHEYVDGVVYAMVGARVTHNTIVLNAALHLRQALRGKPCRVYAESVKLRVNEAGDFVYPDVTATCDPRDHPSKEDRYIRHPWLVAEVLSDSTAAYDRGRKFELYRSIATLTHYLLIEQDRPHADLFFKNELGQWVLQPLAAGDAISIDRLGQPWPVDSLFDGVDFTPAAVPAAEPAAP
jgi:Uma2 family endonuclease